MGGCVASATCIGYSQMRRFKGLPLVSMALCMIGIITSVMAVA